MRGKRFVSFVAAVLLSFSMVFGALAPTPAAAQADELSQRDFEDLVETAQEEDPVYGPEEGELEHDPESVSLFSAEQDVADFLATVTFANPFAGSSDQFDYGLYFRVASDEDDELRYLQFIVVSNGNWALLDSAVDDLVAEGTYEDFDAGRRGENELTIYAEGSTVHLGINGDYIGSGEVDHDTAGDLLIDTAYLEESRQDGEATGFVDFTVWELGGSSRSTGDDEDEPVEEEELEDSGDQGPLGPRGGDSSDEDEDEPAEEEDEPSRDDEEDDSGNETAGGAVYESPTYGYTFQYDDSSWEISDSSEDGIDTAILTNGSTLAIFGLPAQEDAEGCADVLLSGFLGTLDSAGLTGELEPIDSGEISRGPLADSSFFHVEVTGENESGEPFALSVYTSCGPHIDGDYFIGIRHFAVSDQYEAEAELRDEIIGTIRAAGEAADDGGNDEPADDEDDQPSRDDEEEQEDEPRRDEEEDEPEPDEDEDEPVLEGIVYESPTYGFTLRYDDSVWELTGESSNEGLDSASLSNGISTVTLFGLSLDANPAECTGALLSSFLTQLEDNGITGEFELLNEGEISGGSLDGAVVIEVLFTGETDEGTVTLVIYTACGPIGGSDHYVGVRHFAGPDQYEGEAAARDDLLTGLYAQGQEPQPQDDDEPSRDDDEDEPRRDNDDDDDNGDGSGDTDSPNVSRVDGATIYTSPTYGFTVEILPGFSVEQDTVANGYDTLVISNENARITVAGFASSNTAAACVDSIIGNLYADPSFSNVNLPIDPETGAPIRIDEAGFSAVPVYLTYNESGQEVTVGRLYACFSFTGVNGGVSMLVYAYETPADIFIDEFENIVAMLDLILVP